MCDEAGAKACIVTGDKDCRQLITDAWPSTTSARTRCTTARRSPADWGIAPEQVVDFQALVGDKVDNVPGVPLIGPKLAKELLEKYGTLENVLDHADEVPGAKRKQNLKDYREAALLSRKLVELDRHVPVARRLAGGPRRRVRPGARRRAVPRLRLPLARRPRDGRGRRDRRRRQDRPARPRGVSEWEADYQVVDTPEALAVLVSQLERAVADFDRHRNDRHLAATRRDRRLRVRLEAGPGVLRSRARPGGRPRARSRRRRADALRPILENPAIAKIGQNLKYDIVVLRSAGIALRGVAFDTMVADYLLDSGERTHNLDHLARKYLAHETIKIDEVIGTGKNQKRMDQAPVAAVGRYAAEDADVPLRLLPILAAAAGGRRPGRS